MNARQKREFDQITGRITDALQLYLGSNSKISGSLQSQFIDTWVPNSVYYYGKDDWISAFELSLLEPEVYEEVSKKLDILDPPPFAVWARGETLGLDTSKVQLTDTETKAAGATAAD